MPPGLGLSSGWVLTGKPSAAGSFSMTVTVTDSSKPALSATTTFTINIAMTMTPSLPGSVTGAPYPTTTLQAWGGTVPYVWSATGLPTWLSLDPATGVLSAAGNPSAAGTSTFQITVKDGSSPQRQLTTTYSVTIVTGMLITTDTTLPGGVPNVPYPKVTLAVAGGTAPYTWTAQTVLPDGLTLDKDKGELSGTPSLAGSSSITILVTDSATPAVTATATFTLAIASLSVTTAALPDGAVNVPYSALVLQAAGGTPPYRWSATSLPAGLSLSTTGVLSGTPITEIVLPLDDGDVALGAVSVADNTYRVTIDGQAAVVPYAGASKGSVAGLVQINAVVPATARPTNNVPLTVTIGNAATARTSQINVVIAVK